MVCGQKRINKFSMNTMFFARKQCNYDKLEITGIAILYVVHLWVCTRVI